MWRTLPCVLQLGHRGPSLFDVSILHRPVDLVEVDRLHLEAAQAVFHLAADLQQGAPDPALVVPHHAALGEEEWLDRRLLHRLPDDRLGVAKAVDGRRVDPVDAEVDGLADGRDGGVIVLRPPGEGPVAAAYGPRAKSDRREPHLRIAKLSQLHSLAPCCLDLPLLLFILLDSTSLPWRRALLVRVEISR